MTVIPGMRSYPAESAERARQQYLEHGPDGSGRCRKCGQLWKCEAHLQAEAWLFPEDVRVVGAGRGRPVAGSRPRPTPAPYATATMVTHGAYPYDGTYPTQGRVPLSHPASNT